MSADSKPNILPSIAAKSEVVAGHTTGLERCRVLNSVRRSVTLPSAPDDQSRRRRPRASKAALASPVRADPCGLARLIQAASLQGRVLFPRVLQTDSHPASFCDERQ